MRAPAHAAIVPGADELINVEASSELPKVALDSSSIISLGGDVRCAASRPCETPAPTVASPVLPSAPIAFKSRSSVTAGMSASGKTLYRTGVVGRTSAPRSCALGACAALCVVSSALTDHSISARAAARSPSAAS